MKTNNNYILRFDSKELAQSLLSYFPIKATYSEGFTIIISSASNSEWKIYLQLIGLLRQKKINIALSSY